jgi:hypothetical protein
MGCDVVWCSVYSTRYATRYTNTTRYITRYTNTLRYTSRYTTRYMFAPPGVMAMAIAAVCVCGAGGGAVHLRTCAPMEVVPPWSTSSKPTAFASDW